MVLSKKICCLYCLIISLTIKNQFILVRTVLPRKSVSGFYWGDHPHYIDVIISDEHKLVYIDNVEAGSSSIRSALQRELNASWWSNSDCCQSERRGCEDKLKRTRTSCLNTKHDDYFHFSFVRHPVTKFESGVQQAWFQNEKLRNMTADELLDLQLIKTATANEQNWISEHLQSNTYRLTGFTGHHQPTTAEPVRLDFVGRIEYFDDDLVRAADLYDRTTASSTPCAAARAADASGSDNPLRCGIRLIFDMLHSEPERNSHERRVEDSSLLSEDGIAKLCASEMLGAAEVVRSVTISEVLDGYSCTIPIDRDEPLQKETPETHDSVEIVGTINENTTATATATATINENTTATATTTAIHQSLPALLTKDFVEMPYQLWQVGPGRTATSLQFQLICLCHLLQLSYSNYSAAERLSCDFKNRFPTQNFEEAMSDDNRPIVIKSHKFNLLDDWTQKDKIRVFTTAHNITEAVSTRKDLEAKGLTVVHVQDVEALIFQNDTYDGESIVDMEPYIKHYAQNIFGLPSSDLKSVTGFMTKWDVLRKCCGSQMSKTWRASLWEMDIYTNGNRTTLDETAECGSYDIDMIERTFLDHPLSRRIAAEFPRAGARLLRPSAKDYALFGTYCSQYNVLVVSGVIKGSLNAIIPRGAIDRNEKRRGA